MLRSPGSSQNSYKRNVSFNEQDEVIFFDKMKQAQNRRLNGGKIEKVLPDVDDPRNFLLNDAVQGVDFG